MAKERDYKKEYRDYQGKPDQIKNRALRNKARSMMAKKHGESAISGKDIDHSDGNPKNNRMSNLKIMSKSKNRAKH